MRKAELQLNYFLNLTPLALLAALVISFSNCEGETNL